MCVNSVGDQNKTVFLSIRTFPKRTDPNPGLNNFWTNLFGDFFAELFSTVQHKHSVTQDQLHVPSIADPVNLFTEAPWQIPLRGSKKSPLSVIAQPSNWK
jgi:hypothetical protein